MPRQSTRGAKKALDRRCHCGGAYGLILPAWAWLATRTALPEHPSQPLASLRGAAPIQRAIQAGDPTKLASPSCKWMLGLDTRYSVLNASVLPI